MTRVALSRGAWLSLWAIVAVSLSAKIGLSADEQTTGSVRKYDPKNETFVPVKSQDIKPGKIYSHYSPSRGRYVWAYAKQGGGFSYPLGPGSTELPDNFDLIATKSEIKALLGQAAGSWLSASRQEGVDIYVRLDTDDRWRVFRGRSLRSHYDLDTKRRWEWHGTRQVAVRHIHGYLWDYEGQQYQAVNASYSSPSWYHFGCNGPCGFK
ncbi:MAG: hypothetical protein RH917_13285 [Lacipirellulaceae bacterium]